MVDNKSLLEKIKCLFLRIKKLESLPSSSNIQDVSASQSGIVNNTSLQELGGVDKLIHDVRVGQGNMVDAESTAFGIGSLAKDEGGYNTAFGWHTLSQNIDGYSNDAFGDGALAENVHGQYNVALGAGTLQNTQGGFGNTAVGSYALYSLQGTGDSESTKGSRNTALGASSSEKLTTGWGNVSLGDNALMSCTTGSLNIIVGQQAGGAITTGSGNVIIANTGYSLVNGITTGSNNVIVSPNKGNNTGVTTGSNNVIIGKVSGLNSATSNYVIVADGQGNIRYTIDNNGNTKFNGTLESTKLKLSALNTAPTSSSDIGTPGEIRVTSDYIYVCVATNTWKRTGLVPF